MEKSTVRRLSGVSLGVAGLLVLTGCAEGPTLNQLAKEAGYINVQTGGSNMEFSVVSAELKVSADCVLPVQIERHKDEDPHEYEVRITIGQGGIPLSTDEDDDSPTVFKAKWAAKWAKSNLNLKNVCKTN